MPAPVVTPGPCPECGGQVERVRAEEGGVIEERRFTSLNTWRMVARPASFYACTACEWCSESAPFSWTVERWAAQGIYPVTGKK